MPIRDIHLPKTPERIAIIKPSALGDIAHSLPVLSALRQRFPAAHLAWVVNRGYAPILEGHPNLNEIIPFDRAGLRKSWIKGSAEFGRFLYRLRKQRFDLVIDLQGLFRTGLMTLATGAPIRIGLASAREGALLGYTHRVNDRDGVRHAVDGYWRVIEALGDAPSEKAFIVPVQDDAHHWVQATLLRFPRPWLVIGVGSRWLTKRWPPDHFAELVQRAQANFGGTAIFVGAPRGKPISPCARGTARGRRQLTGSTTLPQLVAILAACDVMIANDTGPLHLAVALVARGRAVYLHFDREDRAVSTGIARRRDVNLVPRQLFEDVPAWNAWRT